LAFCPWVFWN